MKTLALLFPFFALSVSAATIQMPDACTNPDGMAVDPQGRLVVAAPNGAHVKPGVVFRIDAPGQAPRVWFQVPVGEGLSYAQPMGVCFGPDGALYVCDCQKPGQGRLLRCTFKDDALAKCETVAEGLWNANGVKYWNGKLYLTQAFLPDAKRPDGAAQSGLFMFDAAERGVRPANDPKDPHCVFTDVTRNPKIKCGLNGVAVDSRGALYVGNYGDGRVWKLELRGDGRVRRAVKLVENDPALVTPDGLCVDEADLLYVADMFGDAVTRINPDGSTTVLKKGGFKRPSEPCFWNGEIVVANYGGTTLETAALAEGPLVSTEEFFAEHVDCTIPALAGIPAKMKAGDVAGAEKIFADYVRATLRPDRVVGEWLRPRDAARRAALAKKAAKTLDYELSSCNQPIRYPNRHVVWTANPTYNMYSEWTWQLSRHPFLDELAEYYCCTHDENAARVWVDMLGSWFDQALYPGDKADSSSTLCWRTIEAGIRIEGWSQQIHGFMNSPSVSDHFIVRFFRSVYEHGRRLRGKPTSGNWLIMEMHGLVRIALFYPFFKDAPAWKQYALDRLEKEFTVQIRPDGFQIEQTTGYQMVVIGNYRGVMDAFRRAGEEVPPFIAKGLEKTYEIYPILMRPDGRTPNVNDGSLADVRAILRNPAREYPDHPYFKWFATNGKEGKEPCFTSTSMPWSGAVVFRTSWRPDAVWCYFDCGAHNEGWHMHDDKLGLLVSAYGCNMLVEGGCFDYDTSEMRKYVISTRAHNTVRIDGLDQNRRGGPRIPPNDVQLKSPFDFALAPGRETAAAVYKDGYGPKSLAAEHARRVIFVKDDPGRLPYFVVVDRLSAPDAKTHSYEILWHLDDGELKIDGAAFTDTFAKGARLAAASSDAAAYVDKRGTKTPCLQGWMPIHKPGDHEHHPIPTPVQEGTFTGSKRIVTVLQPLPANAAADLVKVEAAADCADKTIRITWRDGKVSTLAE